ncbi:GRAS family protein RAM1-like [Punica granatum]|uniref:GRAS family protein RAM1-like n=2 Tax=Punica granatum TaxID=22663 RepID=A0A6P8C5B9_PUNGR|nr:GRAS family protein RAM1-like [Punica granatum]
MELALNILCPHSFPLHEVLNNDLAIRRFCPARMEQEQQQQQHGSAPSPIQYGWEDETEALLETDQHSPSASEVDQFVDSFFITDHEDVDHFSEVVPFQPDDHRFEDRDIGSLVGDYDNGYGDVMIDVDRDIQFMGGEGLGEQDKFMSGSPIDQDDPVVAQETALASPLEGSGGHGVDQGLHLVHLLLACAEAVGCRDTQLAESMLAKIWPCVSSFGDSLQRVSYCFAVGLKSRLSLLQSNGNYGNGTGMLTPHGRGALTDSDPRPFSREEKVEAFQLLHQATPYLAFGYLAANEAICQASHGHDRMHIIDLGMEHTLQWASLFRALASRPDGPPKSIRITAITSGSDSLDDLSHLETSLKALADEAMSVGIYLQFQVITDPPSPLLFSRESLNLREGETLFVNSIMKLHQYVKESRGSLKAILQAIRRLGPTLLTVVEQDANHNGPFFLGRFLESLHYYSAVFDSLEASLPRGSPQRMRIERVYYAEEIRNIVACEGAERMERHERADQWRRQLGRAGFQAAGLKCMSRARMMLSVYGCDGYSLAYEKGCLLLGWKGRPIMLASAWQVPANNHAPSSSSSPL